jgi:hypothetical protein
MASKAALADGDADHARLVAAYEVVERLFAVKDPSLIVAVGSISSNEPIAEPRHDLAKPVNFRNRRAMLARRRY